ncbi:dienelactone hydrolase family protein [Duganella sp. CT11-25]|uniref:carboxylesterase family protein n=1 Tax=unclassified Duganella TaxID=2636909 RepID=UPI0039B0ECB3
MTMRRAALCLLLAAACASATAQTELVADRTTPTEQAGNAAQLQSLDREAWSAGIFEAGAGALPYRLLPPPDIQPGQRYPLVIVLHGSGAVGTDNRSQLGQLAVSWGAPAIRARFPAYVLAPQFPERSANYQPSEADGLLAARPGPNIPTLTALVAQLGKQHPIAADRIYITGFSMGASAATQSLLFQPGMFAAAVAFSGIPPERGAAARLSATPLLIVHGNADTENPIEPDRALVAALQRQPGARLRFLEYQGMEHQVPADMLLSAAWRDWLFAQRRSD